MKFFEYATEKEYENQRNYKARMNPKSNPMDMPPILMSAIHAMI